MHDDRSWTRNFLGMLAVAYLLAIWTAAPLAAQSQDEDASGGKPVFVSPPKPASRDDRRQLPPTQFTTQSNLVTMPVTVMNPAGDFVFDLDKNDFQILDNGVPQKITRFGPEEQPLAVVILVQTNEAVGPLLSNLASVGPVISQLLVGPKGQAAVLFYDDRVREAQDFSGSSGTLQQTLKGLGHLHPLGDKARMNDALVRAISMLEKRPKEDRRIILAISNGSDSGSETSRDDVVQRATAGEVSIYGLGLSSLKAMLEQKPQSPPQNPLDTNVARPMPPGMPNTPDMSSRVYGTPIPGVPLIDEAGHIIQSTVSKNDLEYLAGFTGGVFYSQWSGRKLEAHLQRIAAEVHSQYELAYVPNDLSQTGFHRIEIRLRQQADLKIRARAGYFYYRGQTP